MNNKKLIGITLAATVAFSTMSCNRDKFLDINTTPNSPTAVSMPVLLTSTVINTGFLATNDYGRATALLTQQYAGIANQPAAYDVYILRGSFDNQWNTELYGGTLINSQTLIDLAATKNSPAYSGIAKLLKAYNFSVATDLYGDVPYSQALQGNANLHPRYDKQEDIYKGNSALGITGLIDLVKDGLADLEKTSSAKPGVSDDPAYGKSADNIAQWKKMGNMLLLKFANTISNREPALATTLINAASAKAFAANTDDFEVPFGSSVGNQNPLYLYNFVTRQDDQMLSQTILDKMNANNDPRLPIYYTPTPTPATTPTAVNATGTPTRIPGPLVGGVPTPTTLTFTGYINGNNVPVPSRPLGYRSRYNTYITGVSGEAPARLLTNAQRLFILAESALTLPGVTLPNGSNAQSLYQAGIKASMTKAGITSAAVDAYLLANPSVAILSATTETAKEQIITQKWISWVGNGIEAYNDYRRTSYPTLAPALNASGDDATLPKRFPYPLSELTANAGAENQDASIRTSVKVWWGK
ncbi:SusD/RagB family nutrient-binding outer membrane lipoprotein [Hymenobacter artigasi]|uniref:SusD/RagB family nutrient-binding outer membrane lipoprotein n=1 Tax=Hymenobacter artigasi TaxID=2719616 RepID=A0ABX1HG69_9BACT|nr:SusD/RagB family nutrient-binding outer membrane lipoprotein [Hymenobacter artigasi]NKI88157.1 hypothetical protein [Hymenobacter artigasi]